MKVLFLDCDGVLNSREFFRNSKPTTGGATSYRHQLETEEWNETDPLCWARMLDPKKVTLLRGIVEQTGCNVVLSSTWRINLTPKEFCVPLAIAGYPGAPVVDRTPDNAFKRGLYGFRAPRGDEIADWLKAHPDVTAYAVVDDDDDMDGIDRSKFVQTSWDEGMSEDHARRLVEILNG